MTQFSHFVLLVNSTVAHLQHTRIVLVTLTLYYFSWTCGDWTYLVRYCPAKIILIPGCRLHPTSFLAGISCMNLSCPYHAYNHSPMSYPIDSALISSIFLLELIFFCCSFSTPSTFSDWQVLSILACRPFFPVSPSLFHVHLQEKHSALSFLVSYLQ